MSRQFPLSGVWLTTLVACTTTTRQLPPPNDYIARPVHEIARYEVRHDGAAIGALVQLEIEDPSGAVRLWRIENRSGGWLGFASEQGRFSRRVPFRDDDEDLGMWPMAKGVAKLFLLEDPVELRELPVAAPAAARKQ